MWIRSAALCLMTLLASGTTGLAEDLPGQAWGYGFSQVYRLSDNQVKLYAKSWATGPDSSSYKAYIEDSRAFLDSDLIGGPHTHESVYGANYGVECWWTKTVQTTGVGVYKKTTKHRFYHTYWGSTYTGQTEHTRTIERPTVSRSEPAPFWLGGNTISGNHRNYATLSSDPKGATSTPHWYFVAGSNFGGLSCSDCANPTYTAEAPSTGCGHYNVTLVQISF
jgi:hypothetical protein